MKRKLTAALGLAAAAYVYSIGGRKQDERLKEQWKTMRKYRYAHRGLFQDPLAPENSEPAFIRAAQEGYGCELDVHLTKDDQLVVIHDYNLKRATQCDLLIEDLSLDDAKHLFLFDSFEFMPTLNEVLQIYSSINDKLPIIIEIKSTEDNVDKICRKVVETIDGSNLTLCIESFDPRVVRWFKKNYPSCMRGQLSENYFADTKTKVKSPIMKALLTNLNFNFLTKPDFVAYHNKDRNQPACLIAEKLYGMNRVDWTVRDIDEMIKAEKDGAIVIFDTVVPQSPHPYSR